MDIQDKLVKSIKESLCHHIGEAITPATKAKLKQMVMDTLLKAQAEGNIISQPEIHFYSYEDSFCKRCGYDLYNHADPTAISCEIGHPKRPEYCTQCQEIEDEIQEIRDNEKS